MTEDEAKQKMCPYMAILGGLSKEVAADVGIRCIASECMLWRKLSPDYPVIPCPHCGGQKTRIVTKQGRSRVEECFDCEGTGEYQDIDNPILKGYCGLGGKP